MQGTIGFGNWQGCIAVHGDHPVKINSIACQCFNNLFDLFIFAADDAFTRSVYDKKP